AEPGPLARLYYLLRHEGEEGDLAGSLDRVRQHPLMAGAHTAGLPRQNLTAVRREALQALVRLIVDVVLLVDAELARLAPRPPEAVRLHSRGHTSSAARLLVLEGIVVRGRLVADAAAVVGRGSALGRRVGAPLE